MILSYNNCGNIKSAKIELISNMLNIKYGMNGIGKTTLGKCLYATILKNEEMLLRYIPFGEDKLPAVKAAGLSTVLYFDKEYVDQFLFQEDIINGTFEIIVKTPDYDKQRTEIEESFAGVINEINGETIILVDNEITTLINSVKFDKANKNFVGSTNFAKGIKKLNIVDYITDNIKIYETLITSPENHEWIDWFKKGKLYVADSKCPFCVTPLRSSFDSEYGEVVSAFDKSVLKNSSTTNQTLASIRKYTDKDTAQRILTEQKIGEFSQETKDRIRGILAALNVEKAKLEAIKSINPISLASLGLDDVAPYLESFKLNPALYQNVSEGLVNRVIGINKKVDEIVKNASILSAKLSILKKGLAKKIQGLRDYVNDFLDLSGIPYEIETIIKSENVCQTILKPKNSTEAVIEPQKTLSYGELNALSLVLFSVEAVNRAFDLIILDDPVSSFDENKKYALMYHLFSSKTPENLRGKTVLLFTHDFTPIIDFIYNGLPTRGESTASYLLNNSGNINEIKIEKNDIISCIKNEETYARNTEKHIIGRVVHLRNYMDIIKMNDSTEYSILSSLLHFFDSPQKLNGELIGEPEYTEGISIISKYIEGFDYLLIQTEMKDPLCLKRFYLTGSSSDKIIATRLLLMVDKTKKTNKVIWKYLSEFYHTENMLVYGLDPIKFDQIPNHILIECNAVFDKIS